MLSQGTIQFYCDNKNKTGLEKSRYGYFLSDPDLTFYVTKLKIIRFITFIVEEFCKASFMEKTKFLNCNFNF